ncbi:MAG: CBS domain-containing protein [Thiotrichales bacterium]|nr:CBS domain-containing protein [Thiotrichales bacterium]
MQSVILAWVFSFIIHALTRAKVSLYFLCSADKVLPLKKNGWGGVMFIVYTPEGQSLAMSVQQLPMLKVDPATRVNQVEDTRLDALKPDEGRTANPGQKALQAYQGVRHSNQRRQVVQVAEIMSEPIITINQEASLAQAYERMNRLQIDYLPVVREAVLVGLLTREALLQKLLIDEKGQIEFGAERTVQQAMLKQVVSTQRTTDIRQVAQVLSFYRVGALVVMNQNEQPVGIITRGDLIKRLAKDPPIELYV